METDRRPKNCKKELPPIINIEDVCVVGRVGNGDLFANSSVLSINELSPINPPISENTCLANSCIWHAENGKLHQQIKIDVSSEE